MIRTLTCAAAAILLTTGAVAAMADTGEHPLVTIDNKSGDYCVHTPAITGSILPQIECHSVAYWAKQGVTFARR